MFKKILLGAIFLGLIAVLIVGAVNRTNAKTAAAYSSQELRGQNRTLAGVEQWVGNGQGRIAEAGLSQSQLRTAGQGLNGGRRGGQASSAAAESGVQGGRGGAGNGQQGNGQAVTQNWRVVEGTVIAIDDEQMSLMTDAGELAIADRGWRFAREQGFAAQVGDRIWVTGFDENGDFEAAELTHLATQQQVQMREESGRPLWAGGRGGRGQGGANSSQGALGVPYAETEDHQWQTLVGTVLSIDAAQMTVSTAEGDIQLVDRPWDFAVQQGFTAQPGDEVSLIGFDENGAFEVGQLVNETTGQQVQIREESGRPLWAGGGRGRWS